MTTKTKLKAFHGDPAVKQKYLDRLKAHAEADEITKGIYWEDGKGCAVGCTVHSDNHNAYEEELGLPECLARLEDKLFEGLANTDAKTFPVRFLEAIPVGADIEPVQDEFQLWVLKNELHFNREKWPQVAEAVDQVTGLYERSIAGELVTDDEWSAWSAEAAKSAKSAAAAWSAEAAKSAAKSAAAAWSAAAAAAWSAEAAWSAAAAKSAAAAAAAWSAEAAKSAWSAEAAKSAKSAAAAWSAEAAKSAAKSAAAAWSAAAAAAAAAAARSTWSAARSAAYKRMADKLLEMLEATV